MSEQKVKSLTALLNSYPQSVGDLELALRTYLAVSREYTDLQVSQAVMRFLSGKVKRKNREFAPSCEAFVVELDEMAQREALEARRAELTAKLGPHLAMLRGDDVQAIAENPLRRIPAFREKYLAGGGDANANR